MDYSLILELPELTAAMERLERLAAAEGLRFTTAPYGGVRGEADTARILKYREDDYAVYVAAKRKAGQTPVAINVFRPINAFGTSHHNAGAARDLRPLTYKGKWVVDPNNWDKITDPKGFQAAHERLDAICKADPELKATIKVGSDFGDQPHKELRITLDEARRRYAAHAATMALAGGVVGVTALAVVARFLKPSNA